MKNNPKWKKFEELVTKIQKNLSPKAKVTHNDKIRGEKTDTIRQVDVSIKDKIGQYNILIAMECKDLAVPVNVKDVEEFIGLVKDIRANKAAVISAKGFTSAAKTLGENSGIDLYRLVDSGEHEWKTYASIPILCKFVGAEKYNLVFSSHPSIIMQISKRDPRKIIIYNEKNKPIDKAETILISKIREKASFEKPGEYYIELIDEPTKIRMGNKFFPIKVAANILIEERLYFGQIPLEKLSGFKDEIHGGVITRGFTTKHIDIWGIEKEWKKISSADDIAVKPLLTIVFFYSHSIE